MTRPSRRILRHVKRLALLIILGFITTIGVAWTIEAALWRTTRSESFTLDRSVQMVAYRGIPWVVSTNRGIGWTTRFASHPAPNSTGPVADPSNWALGLTDSFRRSKAEGDPALVKTRILPWTTQRPNWGHFAAEKFRYQSGWCEAAVGFPIPCFWKWSSQYGTVREGGFIEIGKRDPNRPWFDPPGLPYLPIPRGLIVNTIFWAGAWWIALFGFTAFKRRRRLRRGRCAHCAYDLRGITSSTCPECGHQSSVVMAHRGGEG